MITKQFIMRKMKQLREESFFFFFILGGETSLFQVLNWKWWAISFNEKFYDYSFYLWVFLCFLFRYGPGKGCCFESSAAEPVWGCPLWGLAAASVSGQEPHGTFWLQGGEAGKIPKCIKTNCHHKFRPRFLLILNLGVFYWMSLGLQKCLDNWRWRPQD